MSEENNSSNEYEAPEISVAEIKGAIEEEPKIDDSIYGKKKPRRVTVDREIVYDKSK